MVLVEEWSLKVMEWGKSRFWRLFKRSQKAISIFVWFSGGVNLLSKCWLIFTFFSAVRLSKLRFKITGDLHFLMSHGWIKGEMNQIMTNYKNNWHYFHKKRDQIEIWAKKGDPNFNFCHFMHLICINCEQDILNDKLQLIGETSLRSLQVWRAHLDQWHQFSHCWSIFQSTFNCLLFTLKCQSLASWAVGLQTPACTAPWREGGSVE